MDVSVLDRDRRPVRGLTPADFTILEDGKPQEIAVFNAVDIPDVSKLPVSLSGLVLSATPGPTAAPRDALKAILPVVPTARRTFTAGDQVTAFVRLYQGGKTPLMPVPLRIRLTNERGTVITDRRQDVSVDRFTRARSADVGVDVPVARLADGEYLLTVQADLGGTTARRDSRFRVAGAGAVREPALPRPLQQRH